MCKYKESVLVQLCMQEPYIPIGADLHEDYTCNNFVQDESLGTRLIIDHAGTRLNIDKAQFLGVSRMS